VLSNLIKAWLLQAASLAYLTCFAAAEAPVTGKVQPFPLQRVRLSEGPFKHAMDLDRRYLLSLDADRLLHNFRITAGIPSAAKPLAGWEDPKCELRGHFIGHYLSACALMFASTGDRQVLENANAVVAGLAVCQGRFPNGYLSAFPEELIDRVEAGKEVWAPYYTLHKLYAGLLDMHVQGGNTQALDLCKKFADWVIGRTAKLSAEQMQSMLNCEHGGMAESLANLYAITNDERYLTAALRFNHQSVVEPAVQGQDRLTGLHANTQIPKFIGTAREYELTGKTSLRTASEFFWNTVVKQRSYVIGGNSDGEYFTPKEHLSTAFGECTTETCNTHNMLKLTRHLFCWEPRAEYADFYERGLYNHILASQDPETGMMCYYVPLRSGMRKTYNGPLDAFWCCTGTGVESHAKYGDSIYFHDGGRVLYLNLFIASELDWKEQGVRLRQDTRYPDEATSRLTITCEQPVEFSLRLRHPAWARTGFAVKINGKALPDPGMPGSYVEIARTWQSGDTVEIIMPFELRTEGFSDNPRRFAFLDGPLVLAASVDPKLPTPVVSGDLTTAAAALTPVAGRPSTYTGPAEVFRQAGATAGQGITLEPFHKIHGGRNYMVYFDQFTPAEWTDKEQAYAAEQLRAKQLETRRVDQVKPGEDQNERDHRMRGEASVTVETGGRKCRQATNGWFSWDVKVQPGQAHEMVVTYWGSDASGHDFDVLVDGIKVATEKLHGKKPGEHYDERYRIPGEMAKDKERVTIRFQAHPGSTAGGVFGVEMLKQE
jgi:DUF1680 family protein